MAAVFISPPATHRNFRFATSLPTLLACCLFDNRHSDVCKVISHSDFDVVLNEIFFFTFLSDISLLV